jgi:hypothetical protein
MRSFAQPDSGKAETETQRSETICTWFTFITSIVDGSQPLSPPNRFITRQRDLRESFCRSSLICSRKK